ncbi:L-serine ammonia-lyase [Thiotrichales bacterium 19S9-12]|nr:L-serine ammonia-lyase [Thiotrichales bacterium 19S9-11]MCF6811567.1 L-serine ammonia-lyase [Thiotrichales bacterium 19S9-12]
MYSIGIGPSSSHTIGPMRAAKRFLDTYEDKIQLTNRVVIDLYGSLALTGKGHCTDVAVLLGLLGETPEEIDASSVNNKIQQIRDSKKISLLNKKEIDFNEASDLIFHYDQAMPEHANGVKFTSYDSNNKIAEGTYFSIGGGFVLSQEEITQPLIHSESQNKVDHRPYPFENAKELLACAKKNNLSIAQMMMANEKIEFSEDEIRVKLLEIWQVMADSIKRGLTTNGILPGALRVTRRAAKLYQKLTETKTQLTDLNWLNAYAIAVNEENAAGSKVVTAPTNGAAGIIPAVLYYHLASTSFDNDKDKEDCIINYLLTAAAIGILFKKGASISAAEVGCQGEVGVATSMAAGGLCAILGGYIEQVENAAEMGMEHNLGLTCDPIGGLVQIPCIERNAMGASQAISAAKLALLETGEHRVHLDDVIKSMKETGLDMSSRYKETSLAGLAISVKLPQC